MGNGNSLSEAQLAALAKGRRLGGLTTARKPAPADCPVCRARGFTSWMQHLAHLGASAGNARPAPEDCGHCRMMGYQTMAQHKGHLAARALLDHNPSAISYVWELIRERNRTQGRPPHR